MFFFSLTIKSPARPCCRSAVFIGSSGHVLRIACIWLWRPHCIYLEQDSTGKRPKDFEAGVFPCCILHKITEISRCKEQWVHQQTEDTFLWWGLCIPSFKNTAYVIDKQSCIFLPSIKTITYLFNGLNTSFCAKDHETHQAISNLNRKFREELTLICVSFLEVLFNSPAPPRLWVSQPYFHLNPHTYLASRLPSF